MCRKDSKYTFPMKGILQVIVFTWTTVAVRTEIYTSSYRIEQLATRETDLIEVLRQYIQAEEIRINELKKFVMEAQRSLPSVTDGQPSYPDDVISGLLLIKRYESTWGRKIPKLCTSQNTKDYLSKIRAIIPEFPTTHDVEGATSGIIRLQRAYDIRASQLMKASATNMTSSDCFRLAEAGFQQSRQDIASGWLHEAMVKEHPGPSASGLRHQMVATLMDAAERSRPRCVTKLSSEKRKNKTTPSSGGEHRTVVCGRDSESELTEDEGFFKLCRGELTHQTDKKQHSCAYKCSRLSYPRWKVETLSRDPEIVLFHDVISQREQDHLKRVADQLLTRSEVGHPDKAATVEARTSQVAWLWDNHTSIVNRLSRRVAEITGLCTDFREAGACAEPLQVLNYGIGGQYHSHYDFYPNKTAIGHTPVFVRESGDRLATFMFYLSDVGQGGATVFPEIGVRVPPVKGSAAFWYNFKDGERDWRTKHGGCPVLRGHKWVANKWIHEIASGG